jgi:uncharacterized protein YfbU (UPF0304 family)
VTVLRFDTEVYESLQEFVEAFESECREVLGTTEVAEIVEQEDSELEAIQKVLDEIETAYVLDYDGGTGVYLIHTISDNSIKEAYLEVKKRDEFR